jgi:hypothetical protein
MVAALNTASYGALYAIACGNFGHHTMAFALLITAIVVMMASAGLFYSLAFGTMMRPDFYGPPEILLANGMIMSAFALGGVASGCLFYFTGLGLKGNMLIIAVLQAVMFPAVVAGVYTTTTSTSTATEVMDKSSNDSNNNANSERAPLLPRGEDGGGGDTVDRGSMAVNADRADSNKEPLSAGDAATTNNNNNNNKNDDDDEGGEEPEPERCLPWLGATLSSWRYYHTILIIVLKVGIGGTFTTNIGSAVAASLPASTPESTVDSKISLVVICLNFSQLVGRLLYTLTSAGRGNPNAVTIYAVMLVAVAYAACFTARILAPFTFESLLAITCAFGLFYGIMWCTTGGLLPFVPLAKNVPRVLAVTQSFGGIGNIVLNTLAGYLYDQQTTNGHTCYGKECYRMSDLIMIAVSGCLFLVAGLRLALGVPRPDGRWPRDQSC